MAAEAHANDAKHDLEADARDRRVGYAWLALNLPVVIAAQFLMKRGVESAQVFADGTMHPLRLLDPAVLAGLFLYVTGTAMWLLTLRRLPVSMAYPVSALQYPLVVVGAWVWLDEPVVATRLAGTLLIVGGVAWMVSGPRRAVGVGDA